MFTPSRPMVLIRAVAALAAVAALLVSTTGVAGAEIDIGELDRDPRTARDQVRDQLDTLDGERGAVRSHLEELDSELDVLREAVAQGLRDLDEMVAERTARQRAAEEATDRAERAAERAELRDSELRDAVVDMFINPPQRGSVAAQLLDDPNDTLFAHGLLKGRTDRRAELLAVSEQARATAARARDAAAVAHEDAVKSEQAARDAAARLSAMRDELEERSVYAAQMLAELDESYGELNEMFDDLTRAAQLYEAQLRAFTDHGSVVTVAGTSIQVHPLIAPDVAALIAHARADGVMLDGWGWRSHGRQIELRRAHCGDDLHSIYVQPAATCSPPTARPGHSMHERGLAIDFANCSTRATQCWQWLSVNASQYGLFNLPSEPWHWSTNGN